MFHFVYEQLGCLLVPESVVPCVPQKSKIVSCLNVEATVDDDTKNKNIASDNQRVVIV